MSRVHGNIKIIRKQDVEQKNSYGEYRDSLREDFGRICGYCGKSELVTKNTFEIDHFIPVRLAPEKENDYANLVYSCYACNRKKAGKWLSEDKNIQFVDGKGFVDPAAKEFDESLERDADGSIVGRTPAGRYMAEAGLEFNIRPIKEIYKAMLLIERKHQLEGKIKALSKEESRQYIEASMAIEEVQRMLFDYKE